MPIIYRTTGAWGPGSGSNLSPSQVDGNFFYIDGRVTTLEANLPAASIGISNFTVSGDQFTVLMTNATTRGPFTLPKLSWNFRGAWLPSTHYAKDDIVTHNGSVYLLLATIISDTFFDANDSDSAGNFYALLLSNPGNALPFGGATGQILAKLSNTDFDLGWNSSGVPAGGTTGQVLRKTSGTDYADSWHSLKLVELADVSASSPTDGDLLHYNGSTGDWFNGPLAGLTFTLDELSNVFAPSPSDGDLLFFNASSGDWFNGSISFVHITGAVSATQSRPTTLTTLATTGTVLLDPTLGDVFRITPTGNVVIEALAAPVGAKITLVVTTSGTSSFTVTPTTNFKITTFLATGTVSGKVFTITFVGDGTNLNETGRTVAM